MNNDAYVECLVKAKKPVGLVVLTGLLGALTVVFFLLFFYDSLFFFLALAAGVGTYFANLYSGIEYEYLYLDKELSVDKIMSQSKRKRVAEYTLDKMEIFAPINSWHLDNYKNRDVKTIDYSIGRELQPDERYVMYYEGGVKVVLSPSEELIKIMKNAAPRKAFSD